MPLTSSEKVETRHSLLSEPNPVDLGFFLGILSTPFPIAWNSGEEQIDNAVVRLQHFAFLLPQGSERLAEPEKNSASARRTCTTELTTKCRRTCQKDQKASVALLQSQVILQNLFKAEFFTCDLPHLKQNRHTLFEDPLLAFSLSAV